MVGYKLSKNDWVTPFFVIFKSVREKLLVTVSFDHPVPWSAKKIEASAPESFTSHLTSSDIKRFVIVLTKENDPYLSLHSFAKYIESFI